MKKIILFLALCFPLFSHAADIPSRLLKGINVNTDEFTGRTTYKHPFCNVHIILENGSPALCWELTCNGGPNYINVREIKILADGRVTDVVFTEDEHSQFLFPVTVQKRAHSTSGHSAYTYEIIDQCIDQVVVAGEAYRPLYDDIVKSGAAKMKFIGDREAIAEYQKKDIKALESILQLYDFLSE